MDYFLFLTRHTVNCRRQTEIKAKSTVQIPFFEKSAEMQLLNSNIPQRARTTRYSNKKAQDLLNLVLFVFCSFFVLQRWWTSAELNRGLTAVRKAFYTFSLRLISGKRFRKRTLLSHAFKVPRRTKEGYSVRAIPHLKWRFFLRRGQRKEKRCLKLN